jgi:outer membrane murein-binding lipoprotein Lpp
MQAVLIFLRLVLLLSFICLLNGCGRDDAAQASKQNIGALQARIAELEQQVVSLRAEKEATEADLIAENETIKQDLRKEFEQRLTVLQQEYEKRVQELDAKLGSLHLQLGQALQEKAILEKRLSGELGHAEFAASSFASERIVWILLLLIGLGAAVYFGIVSHRLRTRLAEGATRPEHSP